MLKAIVFDFDGVIVDSEPLHYRSLLQTAAPHGVRFSYEEYLRKYIGYDDRDAFRAMLGMPTGVPGSAADLALIMQMVDTKADIFEAMTRQGVETIPGAVELIHSAAAQVPTAVASGATTRDLQLILGGLNLLGRFDAIVSADMVERSKPHPESYELAVEALAQRRPELKIEPEDCLAIEDTAAGIESARAAGLLTLGLTTNTPAERLARAHRVVETLQGVTLEQLRAWFD